MGGERGFYFITAKKLKDYFSFAKFAVKNVSFTPPLRAGWGGLTFILFFLSISALFAQDTLSLSPQTILDSAQMQFRSKSEITRFSKDSLGSFSVSGISVDAVLRQAEGLYIRNYGGHGGVKTLSVRGFATQQTTVSINDVPYQNAQTGVVNFAYFYPEDYDAIEVNRAPNQLTNNGLGGNVDFQLKTDSTRLKWKLGAGSFGEKTLGVNTALHKQKWNLQVGYFLVKANDNYDFDINGEKGKRQNAGFQNQQYQAFYERKLKSNLKLSLFITGFRAKQGVPNAVVTGNIGFSTDSIFQKDAFSYLQIQHFPKKIQSVFLPFKSTFTLSYHQNKLDYLFNQKTQSYDNQDILAQLNFLHLFQNQTLNTNVQFQNANLRGNNLAIAFTPIENVFRNQVNISALHKSFIWKNHPSRPYLQTQSSVRFNLLLPSPFSKGLGILPNGNLGIMLQLPKQANREYFAHFQYGNRLPSFNELYYFGYGNATLKPEKILSFDLGLRRTFGKNIPISLKMNVFYNQTYNKIISIPLNPVRWSTFAIGKTQTQGVEISGEALFFKKNTFYLNYTLQKTQDLTRTEKPYLPYTPVELLNYGLKIKMGKNTQFYLNGNYCGWRFSSLLNDKSAFLPAYQLLDMGANYTFSTTRFRYTLFLQAENIFNTQYAVIQSYPMPSRSFRLSLQVLFR
jgi:outer membrane cobalamin receptor